MILDAVTFIIPLVLLNSIFRLMAKGLSVSFLVSRTKARVVSRSEVQTGREPSPPALLTAAVSRGPAAPPIGA